MEFNVFQNNKALMKVQEENGWKLYKFDDILIDDTRNAIKIKKELYLEYGQYPIIDQGKNEIAGYTNEVEGIYKEEALVFGDHTRIIKYIDFPIFLGADGVKLLKLKSNKEKISIKYLYYFLNTVKLPNDGYSRHFKYLKQTVIPVPELDIQMKIVKCMDKANELIDKRKKQIDILDELVKSQFIEMFGNLKDEEKLPLEKCTTFIDYRGKTPTLSESGIRIINAKSVGNGFFKYIDEYISEETYDSWMKRGFPVAGDVLFVTEGHTFGDVCRIPNDLKKFAMGQRVITMRGKGGLLNNIFLAQYMQSMAFKIDIDKYKTGSSAQGIRSKELQKILIPIPNIELQNKFADFVKQVDKLKFQMEKSLEELQYNFNSLMQRAFNGELFI